MNKTNVMRMLDKAKIKYTVHEYECDKFSDSIEAAEKMGLDKEQVFKTLITKAGSGNYYVFVLPCEKELNLKLCASSVNEKSVEMTAVKDLTKISGYVRGGCSPIGMKKPFPTVIHKSCLSFETITVSAGKIGCMVELNPKELLAFIGGKTENIIMQ